MKPAELIDAARWPVNAPARAEAGPWRLRTVYALQQPDLEPYLSMAVLRYQPEHFVCPGPVVMEDSPRELRRHLPVLLAARGRVLVTGLGLGCVVRGLLAKPEVEHVDVVELCPDVLRLVGPQFSGDGRVTLHQGDAMAVDLGERSWDFAWHDLFCPDGGLPVLHLKVMLRFAHRVGRQGCWGLDRRVRRRVPGLLGGRRRPAGRCWLAGTAGRPERPELPA